LDTNIRRFIQITQASRLLVSQNSRITDHGSEVKVSNKARHGDGFSVAASPPLQSRACWLALRL
jgi:hypothetical protein